jgi:hypothetical protein
MHGEWFWIVFVMFWVWPLAMGHRRRRPQEPARAQRRQYRYDAHRGVWTADPVVAPPPPPRPAPRLPLDVQVKVEQIRRKVEVLTAHADRFPLGSRDLYILRRTASDYLPATLDAYLALPPETADRPVAPDGRTALQVLKDQLGLLDSKMDEIAEDVQRQDIDRLLANGRFLEDHFARPPDAEELSLPRSL